MKKTKRDFYDCATWRIKATKPFICSWGWFWLNQNKFSQRGSFERVKVAFRQASQYPIFFREEWLALIKTKTRSKGTGFNSIKTSLFLFSRQTKNVSRKTKVEVGFDLIKTRLIWAEIRDFRERSFILGLLVIGCTVQSHLKMKTPVTASKLFFVSSLLTSVVFPLTCCRYCMMHITVPFSTGRSFVGFGIRYYVSILFLPIGENTKELVRNVHGV